MGDNVTSYVVLGVMIPLAVYFMMRPSAHLDRAWNPGTRIKIASWVGLALLSIWVITRSLIPPASDAIVCSIIVRSRAISACQKTSVMVTSAIPAASGIQRACPAR